MISKQAVGSAEMTNFWAADGVSAFNIFHVLERTIPMSRISSQICNELPIICILVIPSPILCLLSCHRMVLCNTVEEGLQTKPPCLVSPLLPDEKGWFMFTVTVGHKLELEGMNGLEWKAARFSCRRRWFISRCWLNCRCRLSCMCRLNCSCWVTYRCRWICWCWLSVDKTTSVGICHQSFHLVRVGQHGVSSGAFGHFFLNRKLNCRRRKHA